MYSPPIKQLITAFTKLPSVGQRTAERFVFHLLKAGKKDAGELANALKNLLESVKSCEICWDFSDRSPCRICADVSREQTIICVIDEPQAMQAIEKTGVYRGLYHVLRGTLQPDDEVRFQKIKMKELLTRSKKKQVKEIIIALNPDLAGETTRMFIEREMKTIRPDLVVTRLARGLPMGSDLQYADEITLQSALKNRTIL